jgi:hypothetical protein
LLNVKIGNISAISGRGQVTIDEKMMIPALY